MKYPPFYDRVPAFRLYDPLGEFLGAFEDGIVEIGYLDCVRFAGHSCPTVAGAYLMTQRALEILYEPGTLPRRSGIRIEMRAPKEEGVTGVIGQVAAFICGAGDEGGFPGIGPAFSRKNLLKYAVTDLSGEMRLSRIDTGASVTLSLDTSVAGGSAEMKPLMQKTLRGEALPEEERRFRQLWQERVETMLTRPELRDQIALITEQSS